MALVGVCFTVQDHDLANRIAEWSVQQGYAVDRLIDNGSLGNDEALHVRLIKTDALLVVMTPAWMASSACRYVFREAQLLRRPIFPVIVSQYGEFVVGSSFSSLTLSENEAMGLNWLATAIDASANASLKSRSTFRFSAFISYSHADKKEARWLSRAIETYRMPKPLVGRTTVFGTVGRGLGKTFRDDEELKGAADLGAMIQGALAESESLVVICSPRSAASTYVNDEIASFKRLGREARIVPVIIAGKPHDREIECFPRALKLKSGSDGLLTEDPAEPIAVDIREHGKRRTLLKVVAGITGLEFDELEQRDRRRRTIQFRAMAALGVIVCGVLLATWAVVEQEEARQAVIARAAKVLPERQPILAAQLALAGLPNGSDLWSRESDAGATLKASGYAFATTILDPQGRFNEAILTSDGNRLITRNRENALSLWDSKTATRIADLDFIHYGEPTTFDFIRLSPDGTRLLAWNVQGPPQLWDALNGQWMATLGEDDIAVGVEFSEDGRWIVVPFTHDNATLFDAHTGDRVASFGKSRMVAVSANGSRVVSVLADSRVTVLWDGQTGHSVAELATDAGGRHDFRMSPDGERVVARSRGANSATLWDARTGKPIAELGNKDAASVIDMSTDGKRIATASLDGQAVLWDSVNGHRIGAIGSDGVTSVKFSESGNFVVTSSTGHAAFVSDAQTGKPIGEIGTADEGAGGLYFIPGRERVALLMKSIGLVLRDSRSGVFIARLANDNDAYGLRISKDGRLIQAKDANHWVRLWDGDTGEFIGALAGPREGHTWMIDQNNLHAVTLSLDGTVRLKLLENSRDSPPAAMKEKICRMNRNVIGAFPIEERNEATGVGLALRGRPWHACDWQGLRSVEGWSQFIRYWGTRSGLPWEYQPWETSATDRWLKMAPELVHCSARGQRAFATLIPAELPKCRRQTYRQPALLKAP